MASSRLPASAARRPRCQAACDFFLSGLESAAEIKRNRPDKQTPRRMRIAFLLVYTRWGSRSSAGAREAGENPAQPRYCKRGEPIEKRHCSKGNGKADRFDEAQVRRPAGGEEQSG